MKVAILLTMAENESKWVGYSWCWRAILTIIQVYNLAWKEIKSHQEPKIIFVKAVGRTGAMGGPGVEWPASIWHWDILSWERNGKWSLPRHCLLCENRQTHGVRLLVLWSLLLHLGYKLKVRVVELVIQSQQSYQTAQSRVQLPEQSDCIFASASAASLNPFWGVKASAICLNEVEGSHCEDGWGRVETTIFYSAILMS